MTRLRFGNSAPRPAWPSTTLPPKSAASATMHPMPSWKSSPPPTSPPSWPVFRSATPSSPPAKKPAASSPKPSVAPSRQWADTLPFRPRPPSLSFRPRPKAAWRNLSPSGACPPPPAPTPSRSRKKPPHIGSYSLNRGPDLHCFVIAGLTGNLPTASSYSN